MALRNSDKISSRTKAIVRRVARRLGYVVDPRLAQVMRTIASRKTPNLSKVGVLVEPGFTRSEPWRSNPWLMKFYNGMVNQLKRSGFGFDVFWMGEPGMSGERVRQIIEARGIEGILVFNYHQAPAEIDFDFSEFAAVAIGRGLFRPRLDAVGSNLHNDMTTVLEELGARGFRRPGLALDSFYSAHSLHCWEAAFAYYQTSAAVERKVPACVYRRTDRAPLLAWFRKHEPDVVIGLSETTLPDLKGLGVAVPRDVAFVTLIQSDRHPEVAGIEVQYELIAAKCVEIVAEKLRRSEKGIPASPSLILYDGIWCDGTTLKPRVPRREKATS